MKRALTALTLLLASLAAEAQQLVRDGAYVVHYAAFNSTDLSAEIAQRYGIRRAAGRGLLIINAQREDANTRKSSAVTATAQGNVRTLLGDTRPLTVRRVSADGSEDLLAEFSYTPLEFLRFELQVQPQGAPRPLTINFQQQFFGDD